MKIFNELKSKCSQLTKLIIQETKISTNHLTPEIKLHLITEDCRLYHANPKESSQPFNDPFWGFYWPGGQAMSRFILDHPEVVKNKRVLDFGSGCGATTIAAYMSKCKECVANDIDEVAAIAAYMNAKLNNVNIKTDTRNLINSHDTMKFDVVIFGDVFYDEEFASILLPWIQLLVEREKICLIGDPGRHALSRKLKLLKLASYELPENVCIENHGFKFANVFRVQK